MFKNLHFPFFLPFGQSITLGISLLGQLSIGQYVQGLGNPWIGQLKIDQLKFGQSSFDQLKIGQSILSHKRVLDNHPKSC